MLYVRRCVVLALGAGLLAGCAADKPFPPVFNAVFGLSTAQSNPYSVGKIEEVAAGEGDSVVGAAANSAGNCIWVRPDASRFRAACPDGYQVPR